MASIYSPEWIDAFNVAVADLVVEFSEGSDASLRSRPVRLRQEILDSPEGTFFVTLSVTDGHLAIARDTSGTPGDVTLHINYDDAVALHKGEINPTELLASGRLRVRGDLSILSDIQGSMVKAAGSLAGLSQ